MAERFEDYICKYIQQQTPVLSKYLLAAFESKDKYLCYLDMSLGSPVPSEDIRNCELLTDALLFREEIQHTRDGRNRYKLFFLTDLGMEMAQQLEEEGFKGELPETPPITFNSD